jgi:predicted HAD superfamily phosphohydrolase YqeG
MPSEEQIETKKLEFGDLTRHKTLIFDLDETLIHSKLLGVNMGPPQVSTVSNNQE